jgi:hypothetical protein
MTGLSQTTGDPQPYNPRSPQWYNAISVGLPDKTGKYDMHCPDHLLPLLYLQAFNQDVGIRMQRLRGLEYVDAATQAQGTATRTIPCGRSSCSLSVLTLPLAYFVSLRFAILAPGAIVQSVLVFVYLSLSLSSKPFNPSFLFFFIQPSRPLRVSCQPHRLRIQNSTSTI